MIFLDTSFLFALVAEDDANHARVLEVMAQYRGRDLQDFVVTTNHIVSETLTLIRWSAPRPEVSHQVAVTVGRQLFDGVYGRLHQATVEEERRAFEYMARHRDQRYSFVDCLSFVIMEKLGITEALACDSDFTHRFTAIPGPLRS